ncbi:hypothetical protein K7X08_016720 [Anisodus acutangulus]|uniref:Uncharacterized protein n=1 Tax=Anisodus acutangulus TaxID=402998 RepID=A0A9Q1LT68_9SOLA|nr:hypothetical protein K7X08_016720 [Anisodus acutangulus]
MSLLFYVVIELGGSSRVSQAEECINETLNEAAEVEQPVEEVDSDFLDFGEDDLNGVPNEDDSEVDEELRGFRELLRQQKKEPAKPKKKGKKPSKPQEVELGEASIDRGFEDIFKNKGKNLLVDWMVMKTTLIHHMNQVKIVMKS